ncbi:phage major capsid protein [Ruegeria marina]|uniref:Phage major capsid protein, HK97 family n=1 Tax=Ruegeria marina TaxID=639004 RepID=A0A1G6LI51_9RHOB|nr:phage major capsid protein [Ruegeria marina]SDC42455.1 phage major capsid protein, HK97 family [Ruegeria marina]
MSTPFNPKNNGSFVVGNLYDPDYEKKATKALKELAYRKAFDNAVKAVEQDVSDFPRLRSQMLELTAEVQQLRRKHDRPIQVQSTLVQPAKPKDPMEGFRLSKALAGVFVAQLRNHFFNEPTRKSLEKLLSKDNDKYNFHFAEAMLTKSATDPLGTALPGGGTELVDTGLMAFWRSLQQRSALAQLSSKGTAIPFGPHNSISIPKRAPGDSGSMMPAWVSEHATIPVKQATLGTTTINRFKLGVITTATRELIKVSNALGIFEDFILDDLSQGFDSFLLDPSYAAIGGLRPAAITNGADNKASAGKTLENILTDFTYLRTAMTNARRPAIIMNTKRKNALEMVISANGTFPLAPMVAANNLWGMELIHSPYVPEGVVTAVDANAFYHGIESPMIDTSGAVTLAMADDMQPAPQMTGGSQTDGYVDEAGSIQISDAASTVPPTDVRSMFQTNSAALRVVQPTSWAVVDASSVAYLTSVTWGE